MPLHHRTNPAPSTRCPRRGQGARTARALVAWLGACLAGSAAAVETLTLSLGTLHGAGWRAEGVAMEVDLRAGPTPTVVLTARALELPDPVGRQTDVVVRCDQTRVESGRVHCPRGHAQLQLPGLGQRRVPFAFDYRLPQRRLQVTAKDLALAGGQARLELTTGPSGWRVRLQGTDLALEGVAALLQPSGLWPTGYAGAGQVSLHGSVSGRGNEPRRGQLHVQARHIGFTAPAGLPAAEGIGIRLDAQATRRDREWRTAARAHVAGGILCLTACWEFPAQGMAIQTSARAPMDGTRIHVEELTVDHADVAHVDAQATLALSPGPRLEDLALDLKAAAVGPFFANWLQPLLIGTQLEALRAQGQASATLHLRNGRPAAARLALRDVNIDERQGRFGLAGVSGDLAWDASGAPAPSHLRWSGGHLYNFDLGQAQMRFAARPRGAELLRPVHLPILDGRLDVEELTVQWPESGSATWRFDAVLTPVSMGAFTRAVGWPPMTGRLSGVIPRVSYQDRRLEVDGVLLLKVFDGAVTVRNLVIERVFGLVPNLRADIDIRRLDLDALTRAFSFGNIQGRLSGYIHGLLLQNWRPAAFDAYLATPEDDKSTHRISQRAVENLTSLGGGGVGGALSRGFLSVFEQFSYDRLGIRCRLENGVCAMGGVAAARQGYYIVKGGGLPRINVIGYQDRVDWDVLVNRLQTITSGQGPAVR